MKKQTKRIKAWVNEYGSNVGDSHPTARAARRVAVNMWLVNAPTRVAVPLIELRRGEVVVDVEALVEEFWRSAPACCTPIERKNFLRAALKKVGVR